MFFDRVSFSTSTTGTGTITVGSATTGFRTIAGASIPDGTTVDYAIEDGTAWETGTGIVGGTSTTLTRVRSASSTGSLLSLSGTAKCFITPIAASLNGPGYPSGRWFSSILGRLTGGTNLSTLNIILHAMEIPRADLTITDLAARVITGAASQNFQLGIYASDLTTGEPTGSPLITTGDLSAATAQMISATLSPSIRLKKDGLYYIGGMASNSGPAFQSSDNSMTHSSLIQGAANLTDFSPSANVYNVPWRYTISTYGTWIDLTGVSATRTAGPAISVFFKTA